MIMYCCKLKNNIKNKFMHDKHVINSLNKFIKAAIEINNKLYKKIMKWKYNKENHKWIEFISDRFYNNYYYKSSNKFNSKNVN